MKRYMKRYMRRGPQPVLTVLLPWRAARRIRDLDAQLDAMVYLAAELWQLIPEELRPPRAG